MSVPSFLKRPAKTAKAQSDIELGAPEKIGASIVECLRVKGFCVIDGLLKEEELLEVQKDIRNVDRWEQPALLVQQGLLGEEGSNRIVTLGETDLEYPGLAGIDDKIATIATAVLPHQQELGFRQCCRSETLLHEANLPDFTETQLTDEDAKRWHETFLCHKILVLLFLGPSKGTLTLEPFNEDEEAHPASVATEPGLVVVLRTDQLNYNYVNLTEKASFVASSFFLQKDVLRMHRNRILMDMVLSAAELQEFITERCRQIHEEQQQEMEGADRWLDSEAPRDWVRAANRMYNNKNVDVTSATCRLPATWETEVFFISTLTQGLDAVTEVPRQRWDHYTYYSEDASSHDFETQAPKTDCKHGAFVDGLELFDHITFGIAANEVKNMDPGQRISLEVVYDSLHKHGWRKTSGKNSLPCGIFIGQGMSEWTQTCRGSTAGVLDTGSMAAGRLSFALGCKGPSVAIDTDQASALTAVQWACESFQKKGIGGHVPDLCCGVGTHLILAEIIWLARSRRGDFSRMGRCRTFDLAADGLTVADGVGCAVLRKHKMSEAEEEFEEYPALGSVVGGAYNNSGRSSMLTTPHGTSMQESILDALEASHLNPWDIDYVEVHGCARIWGDFIEAVATARALRNWHSQDYDDDGVLCLASSKTHLGNSIEAAGLSSLVKAFHSIRMGIVQANLHMKLMNEHLFDHREQQCKTLLFPTEHMEQGQGQGIIQSQAYAGITAYGWGGTNVHLTLFGELDEMLRPPPITAPASERSRILFWPAGGGGLGHAARPRRGYFLTGTFNGWGEGVPLLFTGDGCHTCVLVLGENRWEQFQILIDNDPSKVLHPGQYKAPQRSVVCGPDDFSNKVSTWMLDGRSKLAEEEGKPGDEYEICLHVAGKWRTVTWRKLPDSSESNAPRTAVPPAATYSIRGDWNNYKDQLLEPDPDTPGSFSHQMTLAGKTGHFVVVRNGDWAQVIYPSVANAPPNNQPILGPADGLHVNEWCIRGRPGDRFRITFLRLVKEGEDTKEVKWQRI